MTITAIIIVITAVTIVTTVFAILWPIKDYKKNSPSYSLTPEEFAKFMQEAKENDKFDKGEI